MQKLSKREDQLMQILWEHPNVSIKEILEKLPEPKPHYNSVATIVKILVEKGFLKADKIGYAHRYSPIISFGEYRKKDMSTIKKKYFGNSFSKMVAYFAKEENLSEKELDELVQNIKSHNKR